MIMKCFSFSDEKRYFTRVYIQSRSSYPLYRLSVRHDESLDQSERIMHDLSAASSIVGARAALVSNDDGDHNNTIRYHFTYATAEP